MTVDVELTIYGANTEANNGGKSPVLRLHRYYNEQSKISVEMNGAIVHVGVSELKAAIEACTAGGYIQ